jgi:glycosyltransferase involved in cell wall biosynthesis
MQHESIPGLSVFIIARDEGDRIGATLDAIKGLTPEIVVVDSGSTDDTVAVARAAGARVVMQPWLGYGRQKRFGEDQCSGPWLLNLDADEVVPPALAAEIRELFAQGEPPHRAYRVHIADQFPGRTAPGRFAHGPIPVRLYRKDAGRYRDSPVHDRVVLAPGVTVGRLRERIHHRSMRSLSHQVEKMNHYSSMQAEDMLARGARIGSWRLAFEMPVAFVRYYVFRRWFLEGFYGFTIAMNAAFSRHLRLAKVLELQRTRGGRNTPGPD